MGGSGSGYFSSGLTTDDLLRRRREAEERTRDDAFETDVGSYLGSLLGEFNSRDVERTREFLEGMESALEKEIDGTVETLFGGSVAKHTYVDGISDVDALVLLDDSGLALKDPEDAKRVLARCLRRKYGAGAVTVGKLAVTVSLEGETVQLLPALRAGEGFKIAADDGTTWSRVSPRRFARELTRANRRLSGKLVPCIKLAKAIISAMPESHRISGYHAEAVAIAAFRGYEGAATPKAMLVHFFDQASTLVARPIRDSTGQSVHVDQSLGTEGGLRRRVVSDALGRVAQRMRNADGAASLAAWQRFFE